MGIGQSLHHELSVTDERSSLDADKVGDGGAYTMTCKSFHDVQSSQDAAKVGDGWGLHKDV